MISQEYRVKLTKPVFGVLLVFVMIAVFWQSTGHDFINYDDPAYVTDNIHVRTGLTYPNFLWAFTAFHASNWHPITWLSHMLDSEIYGLNPKGHHMTNILFHIANTLLLLYLLYSTTRNYWQSLFVAALFAFHPLHVESVAWIAERKDLLSTFFGFVTLILYSRYARSPRPLIYLVTLLAFAVGLMAKPMLVTLPFVMLLWDFWPLRRLQIKKQRTEDGLYAPNQNGPSSTPSRLVLEKIPFFALMLASCTTTYLAQRKGGAVADAQLVPLLFRIINALLSYVRYISNMFWPHNLAPMHPLPLTLTIEQGIIAGLILFGISYLVYRLAHLHPSIPTGWLWYLGTLVPVIGFVQVGRQSMADRYTYLPLIGLFIMISWGVPVLFKNFRHRRVALSAGACMLLFALMILTRTQLDYWKNTATLFDHATKAGVNNQEAYRLLGDALVQQGRLPEAERSFLEALRIQPDYEDVHANLGGIYMKQGRIREALFHYQEVVRMAPRNDQANYNLGLALGMSGNLEESIRYFNAAVDLNPNFAEAHCNLGIALVRSGRLDEGIYHFNKALQVKPDFAEARRSLEAAMKLKARQSRSK